MNPEVEGDVRSPKVMPRALDPWDVADDGVKGFDPLAEPDIGRGGTSLPMSCAILLELPPAFPPCLVLSTSRFKFDRHVS